MTEPDGHTSEQDGADDDSLGYPLAEFAAGIIRVVDEDDETNNLATLVSIHIASGGGRNFDVVVLPDVAEAMAQTILGAVTVALRHEPADLEEPDFLHQMRDSVEAVDLGPAAVSASDQIRSHLNEAARHAGIDAPYSDDVRTGMAFGSLAVGVLLSLGYETEVATFLVNDFAVNGS
jgi:hypothetical protein